MAQAVVGQVEPKLGVAITRANLWLVQAPGRCVTTRTSRVGLGGQDLNLGMRAGVVVGLWGVHGGKIPQARLYP